MICSCAWVIVSGEVEGETGAKVFGDGFWAVRLVGIREGLGCDICWVVSAGSGFTWAVRSVGVKGGCGSVGSWAGAGVT